MTAVDSNQLRTLIAEVVRDVVREVGAAQLRGAAAPASRPAAASTPRPAASAAPPARPAPAPAASLGAPTAAQVGNGSELPVGTSAGRQRDSVQSVTIRNDRELDQFARRLLELFENPRTRADLRTGALRFTLANASTASSGGGVRRIEKGLVNEKVVEEAASSGHSLKLAKGVVVTPLARDRARALKVTIEKETS